MYSLPPDCLLCDREMLKLFWQGKYSQSLMLIVNSGEISLNAACTSLPVELFLIAGEVLEKKHSKFTAGKAKLNRMRITHGQTSVCACTVLSKQSGYKDALI